MRGALSLAAYMALARRGGPPPPVPDRPRPPGTLVWAHASDRAHCDAVVQLAERLAAHRDGVHVLLTGPDDEAPAAQGRTPLIRQPVPDESLPAIEAFLAHWAPDMALWTGGHLRPALLVAADRRGIPLYLIDAEAAHLDQPARGWFPGLSRALLARFAQVMARDDTAARRLRRLGTRPGDIVISGPFVEGAMALPHDAGQRDELARLLRGRPVWLAAMVQPAEVGLVLRAHRAASRLAHRALLILVPDDPGDSAAIAAELAQDGWRHLRWSQGLPPEETTQVILGDTEGALGLWYRVAPITLMGSSLVPGQDGRDPNDPAAHGSAILYGPHVTRYQDRYARFARAGGARVVRDDASLAAAVQRLIAPDQAAAMAHAAWDMASTGAEVTDRILDLVQDTLDVVEAGR